nr:hypothetical protein [uncultured Draconibacterium sp.]
MELQLIDLMNFYGCSRSTAQNRKQEIKDGLKLPKNKKRVLLVHLAKYEGLKVSEVKEILKMIKNV